jgi:hypothetical protein
MRCVRRRFSLLSFRRARGVVVSALLLASLALASTALGDPRVFPFSYTVDTLPKGELEVEAYTDYIPVRVQTVAGNDAWYGSTDFQTELEYGLTSKLELGLYVTFAPTPGQQYFTVPTAIVGDGLKERLKYRFADAGEWPVDLGVYGELVEDQRELELEAKVLLERRLGPVRIAANLSAEREYYFTSQKDWVLNPSGGVSIEATPAVQPGVESFLYAEYTSPKLTPRPYDLGPHV